VRSVAAPESNADEYVINPRWDYDYVSCVGEPALTEPHSATQVVIDFQRPADTTGGVDDGSGSGDASAGDASATGTGGDDDASASASVGSISDTDVTATETDSDSFGGGGADGSDGCGCRSQGPAAPLGGLAMLGLLGLRRRRR
jgi:MYXO-CTERM domain-containing protein